MNIYCTNRDNNALFACSTCGIKEIQRGHVHFHKIHLNIIGNLVQVERNKLEKFHAAQDSTVHIPINNNGVTCKIHLDKVYSICRSKRTGKTYHLHPELVTEDEYLMLCSKCHAFFVERHEISPYSLAKGLASGIYSCLNCLIVPNIIESALLARYLLFQMVIKIKSKSQGRFRDYAQQGLKSHAILFPHDAPEIELLSLLFHFGSNISGKSNREHAFQVLCQYFMYGLLGPNGSIDKMALKVQGSAIV
jgi:hypothetical protein